MSGETYLYVIGKMQDGKFCPPCKIGITQNVRSRLKTIQTSCPFRIAVFAQFVLPTREIASSIELCLHETQQNDRLHGEWFSFHPSKGEILSRMAIWSAIEHNLGDEWPEERLHEFYHFVVGRKEVAA